MKNFLKKILGHEIFRSMVSWATKHFFERFVKHSGAPSYILNVRSLKLLTRKKFSCSFANKGYNNPNKVSYLQKNEKCCNLETIFQKKVLFSH